MRFSVDPHHVSPAFPEVSWPGGDAPPDEDARDRSIAAFRADPKAMMDLVADPETDLFAPRGGSSARGTTSRLDLQTRGREPALARDGP